MSSNQGRKGSTRAALTRRTTKGPLDVDDPLSDSRSVSVSPAPPASSSRLASPIPDATRLLSSQAASPNLAGEEANVLSTTEEKDLSFLLETSIYHPLSNIDTPPQYRRAFPPLPPPGTPVAQILLELERLLKQCHFSAAAHLAGSVLTSGLVKPTDYVSIFHLLSIRYSALELSGNVLLAAQESKALEDVSSTFYYNEHTLPEGNISLPDNQRPLPKHIMPYDLRLQALRLQGIGFGDSRRTIGAFFELGMECRDNLARLSGDERMIWEHRLEEVGVRVVNTLIDMGDVDCARRTLESMQPNSNSKSTVSWLARMSLLAIRSGRPDEARRLLQDSEVSMADRSTLLALIEIADGNFQSAAEILSQLTSEKADPATVALAKQNLAVAYLYTGEIDRSKEILESLVEQGYSFQTLTINLTTLYDLVSDRSKQMKTNLIDQIADHANKAPRREYVNTDFKL